jgi:hypothetical protein
MADGEPPVNVGSAVALILALSGGLSVVVLSVAYAVRASPANPTGGTVLATGLGAVLGAVISWLAHHQNDPPPPRKDETP